MTRRGGLAHTIGHAHISGRVSRAPFLGSDRHRHYRLGGGQDRHRRAQERRSHHLRDQEARSRQADGQDRRRGHDLHRVGRHPVRHERGALRARASERRAGHRHARPSRGPHSRRRRCRLQTASVAQRHRAAGAPRRHAVEAARRIDFRRVQLHRGQSANTADAGHDGKLSQPAMVLGARSRFVADEPDRCRSPDAKRPDA